MHMTNGHHAVQQPESTGGTGAPAPSGGGRAAGSSWRRAAGKLALLTGSVVLCLVAAELVLRFYGMANPVLYREDARFGYEPQPNQVSRRLGVAVNINDLALRDEEKTASWQGAKKILVVGDSVTFGGSRVRQCDLFTEVLERSLQSSNGAPIKVLNAGVNGYSVTQMLNRARVLIEQIKPDFLIVYVIEDDFHRPPLTFLADGNFVYPTRKPHSALGQFLLLSVHHLDKRHGFLGRLPRWLARVWERPRNRDAPYDTNRVVDVHVEALQQFVHSLWEQTGRSRNAMMICLAPTVSALNQQSQPNTSAIARRLQQSGLSVADLTPDFHDAIAASGTDARQYYWDNAHYLEKGHALAADILRRRILEAGWTK